MMPSSPRSFSRRDFLKAAALASGALLAADILAACSPRDVLQPTPSPLPPTATPTHTAVPSPTNTNTPTASPTPEKTLREKLIEKYGTAVAIPALEYHGDYYSMFDGAYYMDPKTFEAQMQWFQANEYYAVNGEELLAFLNGTLDLPAHAIILTTDSGNTSLKSMPHMLEVLPATGMHFHSFILTGKMGAEESAACTDNQCWDLFIQAANSGCFTLGCHSDRHRDFAKVSVDDGLNEFRLSKQKIEDHIGKSINSISWPYESWPEWEARLAELGFQYAFAGRTRTILDCTVYKNDLTRWHLPRIFPANPNGMSGRPDGFSMQEIMDTYNKRQQ